VIVDVWVDVSGDAVSQLDLMRSASTITLIVPEVRAVDKYSTKKAYICILYLSCCNQPVGEVCTPNGHYK
jgi:hypothetical protein